MQEIQYDVIVAGGGLAGVFAAISCAREGLKVLLLERYGFLGGAATTMLVNPFMSYYTTTKDGEHTPVNAGLFKLLLERLAQKDGMFGKHTFNEEILKLVLDQLVQEYRVDVLFHSFVFSVERQGDRITGLQAAGKSGVGMYRANYFVDATGDADLSLLSGCTVKVGREQDGLCQPMTTCFRIKKSADGAAMRPTPTGEISRLYNIAQREGCITNPREDVLLFPHACPDTVHFNSTRVVGKSGVDTKELTEAEFEGRRQVYELYCFLRDNIPEYKGSTLVQIAPQVGVRESRRIVGSYVITADDVVNCVHFADSIARACYGIDVHNPAGSGTIEKPLSGDYYTIPLRALIPDTVDNLIVAGRPISSDHEAHSALRVMPIASSIGEAAGCAVAVAATGRISLREVPCCNVQRMLTKYEVLY